MVDEPNRLASLLEVMSKGTAALAAAAYVIGFLVVSIHSASFGLSSINPLRPRILTAGAWFIFFSALPAYIAMQLHVHSHEIKPEERFAWACVKMPLDYLACMSVAFGLHFLFELPPSPWFARHGLISGVLVIAAGMVLAAATQLQTTRHLDSHPIPAAAVSLVLVVGMIVFGVVVNPNFSTQYLGWWFFGVGIFALLHEDTVRHEKNRREKDWVMSAMVALFGLYVFPLVIYPHIKASWGGGSPIPVIIYLSDDSRILPGQQLSAELLEESDFGLYVAQKGQRQALFIPRTEISAVYFSDKPLDDGFLRKIPTRP
jgi:hypothetical protein